MSKKTQKQVPPPIESESDEEQNTIDDSSLDDSNASINSSQESSVESIEIAPTDDELEETGVGHENSRQNDESHEESGEGRHFIDGSAQESGVNDSNAAEKTDTSDDSDEEEEIGVKHKKVINKIVDTDTSDEEQEEHPVSENEQSPNATDHSRSVNDHSQSINESPQEDQSPRKRVHIKEEAVSFYEGESEVSDEEAHSRRLSIAKKRQSISNRRRSMAFGMAAPESSDEEEEAEKIIRRRTFYKEQPEGDIDTPVEEQAFSKATRRSIFGVPAIKEEAVSFDKIPPGDLDTDDEIIISDSEEDSDEDKENFNVKRTSQLSSTLRSPLKDETNSPNTSRDASSTAMQVSPENSSAAASSRDASSVHDVSDQKDGKVRVPRSLYEEACRERDTLVHKINTASNNTLLSSLPDKGAKLIASINHMKKQLEEKKVEISNMIVDDRDSILNRIKRSMHEDSSYAETDDPSWHDDSNVAGALPTKSTNYLNADDVQPKFVGKVGMKNFLNAKAITVETLQTMAKTLDGRPGDDVLADPPKYLKIDLMKHQLQAISFMMWRESQKPRGGILADDMGLGKTLTAIALVLKQQQLLEEKDSDEEESEDEERSEWIAQGRRDLRAGGTLIVCPASLLNQWADEIKSKVKRGALDVCVFHGAKRPARARELAKYDVVITTYQIIVSEEKQEGCIFEIRWDRIILDEGHVIRNHMSKQNVAVCKLEAKHRWVMTGTPVHNKEFDMYAVIKFLRVSPFDDVAYWRQWIECDKKNSGVSPRLQTLLKSILLRRTKQQLMESGDVDSLPEKAFEEIVVNLNPEEKKVYFKMASYSQTIFAQYLEQQQAKNDNFTYDKTQLHRVHSHVAKRFNIGSEVKAHMLLVLLLRLRQVCCHPGLIKEALDGFGLSEEANGMDVSANESSGDLLQHFQDLQITDQSGKTVVIDEQVYNMDIPSSKLEKLLEILREKLETTNDKIIIVSQWVSFLDIVKKLLEFEGIEVCEITGKVPVRKRNDVVVKFNDPREKVRVMMLSITAGGVGLNLVGANLLFILDPHWNPQIEQQAQDRIYRFGQKKNVKIVKFICNDTVEEKVLKLQKQKLELATSTLTGAKRSATKLTLNDLKELFGMGTNPGGMGGANALPM